MQMRRSGVMVALVTAALIVATGCVTKKTFRQNVDETEQRITGVESAVESNERRISELATETDDRIAAAQGTAEQAVELGSQAMDQAAAAHRAAEKAGKGKLLWEVTLSDDSVRFSFDQTSIPPDAAGALDDLVGRAKGLDKAVYFEIEGHTDNIGSEEYNLQLGEKRGMAVRNYLNGKGIPLHAVNVISYGESKPVADNSTPEGRSQNRRVVIRVLE